MFTGMLTGKAAGTEEMRLEHSAEFVKNLFCQDEESEFYPMASATTGRLDKWRAVLRFAFQMVAWAVEWVGPRVARTGSLVSLSLLRTEGRE